MKARKSRSRFAAYLIVCMVPWWTVGAQERGESPAFEETVAPEVTLTLTPDETALPEAPGTKDSAAPEAPTLPGEVRPTPAEIVPEWWSQFQGPLNQALDQQEGATTQPPRIIAAPAKSMFQNIVRGVIALCVVLALILISYYLLGRFGKKTPLFAGAHLGQILGRLYLSPRACLYFVKVKDKVLVVGVTPASISQVAELPAEKFDAAIERKTLPATPQGANSFLTELKSQVNAQAPDEVDDEIAALRGDLDRLQRYLQESTREISG
ncbi:MAG: hypothetical protein AMXMBFR4_26920 [Candidatus Hydrogenedentota bacterium]